MTAGNEPRGAGEMRKEKFTMHTNVQRASTSPHRSWAG